MLHEPLKKSFIPAKKQSLSRHYGHSPKVSEIVQPSLKVGAANDVYEKEADQAAEKVMQNSVLLDTLILAAKGADRADNFRLPTITKIQRMCKECEQESESLQAKSKDIQSRETSASEQADIQSLKGGGKPLPENLLNFFEARFGHNFSRVRIHHDMRAANVSKAINARAFTYGSDIGFAQGEYLPDNFSGQKLLAHELTHVIQQGKTTEKKIQRHTLENDPSTAPSMSCRVATSSPSGISLDVTFSVNSSSLSAADKMAISNFVRNWHLSAVAEPVRVDGYASIDGPPSINWPLSCQRAEILASELMTPSDGSPGIPATSITLFAQGETEAFSSSLAPNRRAQAHIPSIPMVAPEITSQTVQTVPGARTRTDIGVGEEVDLTHTVGGVSWSTTAGTLSLETASSARLTAPDTAQSVTVSAGSESLVFNVIAPTGIHRDREPGSGIRHNHNFPDIGMRTNSYILPDNVNFYNTSYREVDVPAVTSGTYSCHSGVGHDAHPATISVSNTVTSGKGSGPNGRDSAYSGHCGGSAPFVPGSLSFAIPNEYQVGSGTFHRFVTTDQIHVLENDASTLTVTKAGASATTTVTAATSNY